MTSNPIIRNVNVDETVLDSAPMTAQGAVNKTILLTLVVLMFALISWNMCAQGYTDRANLLMIVSSIGGLILAIISAFKPHTSRITAPGYAICEGLLVGAVSFAYNSVFKGIIINAIAITFLALLAMLFLYKARVIQATPVFRKVIMTSTVAIAIFYLAGFIGALFGHPMTIFNGGILGIVISLIICVIAAFNFILDFDFIEQGNGRLPDYFEWYCALSLLITVIWLYFEVLRLLAQLNSDR